MSLTLNMVGGGGGFLSSDAVLFVQAPAGSTVTISKGSVSKSDFGHLNHIDPNTSDYYFLIHSSQFDSANPWTVTAVRGSETKSKSIIIDQPDQYDLVFRFRFYLVQNGVILASYTKSGGSFAKSGSNNYALFDSNGNYAVVAYTKLNVTGYSTYNIVVPSSPAGKSWMNSTTPSAPLIGIGVSAPTINSSNAVMGNINAYTQLVGSSGGTIYTGTRSLNISSYTGDQYLCLSVCGNPNYHGLLYMNDVYLA